MAAEAPRPLVLVGMMGSGKTTVGRILSQRTGRPLLDSDEEIERRTGRTVAEIFRTDGEAAFRVLEAEALADALASQPAPIVAAAGGVVLDARNRSLLVEQGTVVWLHASAGVLLDRILHSGEDHRPLLDDDPAEVLRQMERDRTALYQEVADVMVEVADRTPVQVADAVEAALAKASS